MRNPLIVMRARECWFSIVLYLICFICVNIWIDSNFTNSRIDLTADKIYTISEATNDVLKGIKERPPLTHVVLTGRGANKDLINNADLVTEMNLLHHPFKEQGVKAQKGIEF